MIFTEPWVFVNEIMFNIMLNFKSDFGLTGVYILKVVSATFLLVCFLSLSKSTCQTRKNDFYFNSKALFILEKIKF